MAEESRSAGYVEVEGRIARFRRARCCRSGGGGVLEIRAEGHRTRLVLSGINFGEAAGAAELAGRVWQPGEEDLNAQADALAESELVVGGRGFVFVPESLRVESRRYDERADTLSISFE